ncbi:MAG: zinc-ribbon domain-containing protein [Candidatus Thorarchaeota archaeon]|nr:zinc-ribbon domain-containing protein [Candidatus Thorarchaeota archaeon]
MAYKVIIRCSNAEDIIRLLQEEHGADYSRIWRIDGRTIGVFSFEWTGVFAGYVSLITLDHDKILEKCEVTIIGSGGGIPSLDSVVGSDDPGKRAVKDLANLANERGWEISIEMAKIKSRGTQCPNCGSAYVYSKEKIKADGSVVCQNCGKRFIILKKD